MKKIKIFVKTLPVAAVASATAVTGCGGYTPDSNSYYYDNGETYRVIGLDEDKTVKFEKYGLFAVQIPVEGAKNVRPFSFNMTTNTLFFDATDDISAAAAECVYSYLRVKRPTELTKEYTYLPSSGLCSYNKMDSFNLVMFVNEPYAGGEVVGSYAPAMRYTFNYSDRSKADGSVVKSGSFCVLLTTGSSVLGHFDYDDFTDLYAAKGAEND